jgi:hypothetical protein
MRWVMQLQTPTVFLLGEGIIYLKYWMYMGLTMLGRLKWQTAEPLVTQPNAFEVETAIKTKKTQITRY